MTSYFHNNQLYVNNAYILNVPVESADEELYVVLT